MLDKNRERFTAALGSCVIALILVALCLFITGGIHYFMGDLLRSQCLFLMSICILFFLHSSYIIKSVFLRSNYYESSK